MIEISHPYVLIAIPNDITPSRYYTDFQFSIHILSVLLIQILPSNDVKQIFLVAFEKTIIDQTMVLIVNQLKLHCSIGYVLGLAYNIFVVVLAEGTLIRSFVSNKEGDLNIIRYISYAIGLYFVKTFINEMGVAASEMRKEKESKEYKEKADADRLKADTDRENARVERENARVDRLKADADRLKISNQYNELQATLASMNGNMEMVERFKANVFQEHKKIINQAMVDTMNKLDWTYAFNPYDQLNAVHHTNASYYANQNMFRSQTRVDDVNDCQLVFNDYDSSVMQITSEVLREIIDSVVDSQ